jgi:hypothetical protein
MSCCGEADAFEADSFELEDKHYVAIISDGKGVIPNGTTQDEVGRQLSTATGSSSSAPKAKSTAATSLREACDEAALRPLRRQVRPDPASLVLARQK